MPCSVVSAQRHRAGHVSLVSRGSQQRGFVEAGTVGLMTWGGGEEHVKSDTAVPSWESASRCPEEAPRKPRGSPKHEDPEIQKPIQTRHSQRLAAPSRSSEKPKPSAETHMLICTAERSAPAVLGFRHNCFHTEATLTSTSKCRLWPIHVQVPENKQ
ncbi:hypothetical protein NQZ68_003893 [Dissostichus eleginoides]|nr:hypothetical protein NQZ68_003893 [Dissostichus eleginoides]